jgi:hypothetical protein
MEKTEQKLQVILSEIEDAPLREDIFNNFHIRNPLDFAKFLIALDLPDSAKAKLLACKVSAKQKYNGEGLDVLIERAAQLMWARLAEDAAKISA